MYISLQCHIQETVSFFQQENFCLQRGDYICPLAFQKYEFIYNKLIA